MERTDWQRAFTLIELSIVLVIIGLIVGGILVGRDLINAAEIRAQITQIEKYNQAVNTFRSKYNELPGDMSIAAAQKFGFTIPSDCVGQQGGRDGNGLLDGYTSPYTLAQIGGETGLFWQDLSQQNLIEQGFPQAGAPYTIKCSGVGNLNSAALVAMYVPTAKVGTNNFVLVYENSGANWFEIEPMTAASGGGQWPVSTGGGIKVSQTYQIDKKIDDGAPTTGRAQALYIASGNLSTIVAAPNTATSGGTSSSCYDTTTNNYSIAYNNGSGVNCSLSIKFQ